MVRMLLIAACFLGLPLTGPFRAEEAPVLRLGIFEFYPWAVERDGVFETGITVDVMQELARLSGREIEPVFLPLARAFREVEEGRVDLILAYKLDSMVPGVTFLTPVLGCATAIIVTHRDAGIAGFDDLPGKRIGFVNGGYFHDRYRGRLDVAEMALSDNRQMMLMLLRRRIDGFVVNNVIFDAFMEVGAPFESDLPADWRARIGTVLEMEPLPITIGVSHRSRDTTAATAIEHALRIGQEDGSFARVFRKWGSKSGWAC